MDTVTNKSRGFGFVLFSSPDCVKKVLLDPEPHVIDGKKVDAKRAVPHLSKGPVNPRARKVFVGALHESIDEIALKEHFSQFGKVGDIDFPTDKATSKRRGFCFVALENEEQVASAAAKRFHEIRGYTVEVKFAVPKEDDGQGDRFSGGARGGYQGNRDNQGFQSPYYNYYYPSAYGYYDYMNPYYQGYQAYGGGGGGGYSGGYYGRGSAGPGMASMPGGAGGDPYQGQDYSSYGPMRSSSSQYGGNPQFRPY
ncbi:heterogeneous nuclear ribonucleoprotein D-like isoform X2 [Oscarella lobularis]